MKTPRLLTAAAAVVLAFSVAACGGGDDAADTTAAPTTTAAATTTTAAATTTTAAATTTTAAAPTTTAAAPTTTAGGDSTMGEPSNEIAITIRGDRFSTDEIVITAGQEVTIVVDDQDTETDAAHNFHVRTPNEDFFTDIKEAPNTQTLTFSIDIPGTYEFFCDTHAVTMNGIVIVQEDM